MAIDAHIALVGETGGGKSSIMNRWKLNTFNAETNTTIGVDFVRQNLRLNDVWVTLQVWDTAGQERFRAIVSSIFRRMAGCIAVFDLTDQNSFNQLKYWINLALDGMNQNGSRPIIVVVGNKVDLVEYRQVRLEEVNELLKTFDAHIHYFETSALSGEGIIPMFEWIADTLASTDRTPDAPPPPAGAGQTRWKFSDKVEFEKALQETV